MWWALVSLVPLCVGFVVGAWWASAVAWNTVPREDYEDALNALRACRSRLVAQRDAEVRVFRAPFDQEVDHDQP